MWWHHSFYSTIGIVVCTAAEKGRKKNQKGWDFRKQKDQDEQIICKWHYLKLYHKILMNNDTSFCANG